MELEQYQRWKDFAFRMVNIVVGPRRRSPSRAKVREDIECFFECRMDPYEEWKRVENWDHTEKDPAVNYYPMSVGDNITDLAEHIIPGYWALPETEAAYERAAERYLDPVRACVRAGLDIAVEPSAGVDGFTAGDIRKMYPEGVPDWVKAFFSCGVLQSMSATSIEGIYVPSEPIDDPRTFDELPDDQGVWL